MSGPGATFATFRIWDEAEFRYREVVICQRGGDRRSVMAQEHRPPLVILVNARYGADLPFRPADCDPDHPMQ